MGFGLSSTANELSNAVTETPTVRDAAPSTRREVGTKLLWRMSVGIR